MGFTVAHQGGTKDSEYLEYARLLSRQLLQDGVNLDEVPRVRDEGAGKAWLYVWNTKDEAVAFAEALKKRTRDSHWFVQTVRSKPSVGPLRPLEINVSRQGDGWTFGLEPFTREAIRRKFPESGRYASVFVGAQSRGDLSIGQQELHDLTAQVLAILTGLNLEQLRSFGSYRLVDPVTREELLPPTSLEKVNVG